MIEVLKQLVEALEWCYGGEPIDTAEAIKAGKQAIAELESQEPDYWLGYGLQAHTEKPFENATALYTHPPQLEQNFCPRCGKRTNDIHTCTPPQGIYYTPSQRTWVGLTEQEQFECMEARYEHGMSENDIPQIIEAKLKEKNT